MQFDDPERKTEIIKRGKGFVYVQYIFLKKKIRYYYLYFLFFSLSIKQHNNGIFCPRVYVRICDVFVYDILYIQLWFPRYFNGGAHNEKVYTRRGAAVETSR